MVGVPGRIQRHFDGHGDPVRRLGRVLVLRIAARGRADALRRWVPLRVVPPALRRYVYGRVQLRDQGCRFGSDRHCDRVRARELQPRRQLRGRLHGLRPSTDRESGIESDGRQRTGRGREVATRRTRGRCRSPAVPEHCAHLVAQRVE